MKETYVFFEVSWNEESKKNRRRKILDRRTRPTRETEDDTEGTRG